jgi:biotin carboxylase
MTPAVLFINTRFTLLESHPYFFAARRAGLDVVLLADRPIGDFSTLAAETVIVDTYDADATVAAARAVAARRTVAGVVTWSDRDVEVTAQVAAALHLPGHPPAAAATVRNKGRLREVLRASHPDLAPAFRVIRNEADIEPALGSVPLPAILKPTGASGSKGIFMIRDAGSMRDAFGDLMEFTRPEVDSIFRYYPGELILEEFLDGSEHSVEGIVQDGSIRSLVITDKWVREPFFLEYMQIQPSRLPAAAQEQVRDAAARTVAAAGLTDGAFHLELKVTGNGRPAVLELNGRTGGGFITSHMAGLTTGYDFLGQVLRAACRTGGVDGIPEAFCAAGSLQVITEAEGTFHGFANLGDVLSIPGVLHFTYELRPGSQVKQPPATFTTPVLASFIARGATPGEVERILLEVNDLVEPVIR